MPLEAATPSDYATVYLPSPPHFPLSLSLAHVLQLGEESGKIRGHGARRRSRPRPLALGGLSLRRLPVRPALRYAGQRNQMRREKVLLSSVRVGWYVRAS